MKKHAKDQLVDSYISWMKQNGYADSTIKFHEQTLNIYFEYISNNCLCIEQGFTFESLEIFKKKHTYKNKWCVVKGFSRYLFKKQIIQRPITNIAFRVLPDEFEDYLLNYEKIFGITQPHIDNKRRVLYFFNLYLSERKIRLANLKIEIIDEFLSQYNSGSPISTIKYRLAHLREFLRYLHMKGIIKKNLASLIITPRIYHHTKPPKFLRSNEVKQLLKSLLYTTPREIRASAFIHIACDLGLRIGEISKISLDDISFQEQEIKIPERKGKNPVVLPLPEGSIKAISAYLIGGRPKTTIRAIFIRMSKPLRQISSTVVRKEIDRCMKRAKIEAAPSWLRHTYAQQLLENGASIYEIKEMMGHESIETTKRYLSINIKHMREVLFEE
ncbi:Tyrosine recombinase XerC [Candidatus Magnetomorum sp. HK-1]|nr:Tyrosine recombinase XerC [Candidatus Magnetomorum sp. HK-1]